MGIQESNFLREVGFWSPSTVVEKLFELPHSQINTLSNIQDHDLFIQWSKNTSVWSMVGLLTGKDGFESYKVECVHAAYAFKALTGILLDLEARIKRRDFKDVSDMIASKWIFEIMSKYLPMTTLINPTAGAVHTKHVPVGDYFFDTGWPLLDVESRQQLKVNILTDDKLAMFRTKDIIFRNINPDTDIHLYTAVKEAAKNSKYKVSAWIALLSYGKVVDHKRILNMLNTYTEEPNRLLDSSGSSGDVANSPGKYKDKNVDKKRTTALLVINKFPNPIYWDSLQKQLKEVMAKQEEFVKFHPDDKLTFKSVQLYKTFALLLKAIMAYKDENAREILLNLVNTQYDMNILAWKNFKKRLISWLGASLASIDDPDCFYIDIMKEVAKNGKLSLPLMKRIMNHDKSLALSWMCDIRYPIVIPGRDTEEDHLDSIDNSAEKRLNWVLEQIVENYTPNKIDVICHYTINADYNTCTITNRFAVMFKEDQRVIKALLYQLKNKNHGIVIAEAIKALLSFNNPEIDKKLETIVETRKKEKGFDKQKECDRLLEHKPRKYPN